MRVRATAILFAAALALLAALSPVSANETITYTYDALGRLVKVDHGTVGPNANVVASYTYDHADNRCNVTVSTTGATGAGACAASSGTTTLTLSPATVPNGTVGTAYTSTTITATGGTGPYTFAVSAGTLPAGLALSSGGVLSGNPTTAATYSFTVTATDSAGNTGTRSYSAVISPANNLTLSPATLPNGTLSTAYSQTITASGGTAPYTFTKSTGTLPAGLTLSSGGVLSGTPTTAATSSFTVKATDSTGNHIGSKSYSVTIGSSASTCSGVSFSVSDPSVVEGSPLLFTVTKAGSTTAACSVNYATADGTATASFNYLAASGTLSFSSSQTSQTVSVSTIDNGGSTGTSVTMFLNLSSPTNGGTISDSQGVGSIFGSGTGTCGGNVCGLNATPEAPSPAPADSGTISDPTPPSSDTTDTPPPPQGGE